MGGALASAARIEPVPRLLVRFRSAQEEQAATRAEGEVAKMWIQARGVSMAQCEGGCPPWVCSQGPRVNTGQKTKMICAELPRNSFIPQEL